MGYLGKWVGWELICVEKKRRRQAKKEKTNKKTTHTWPHIRTYAWIDHVRAFVRMYKCVLFRHKELTQLIRRTVSQITSSFPEDLLFHLYPCISTSSRKEFLILGFPYVILRLPLPWHSVSASSQKWHSESLQHPSGNGYPLEFLPLSLLVHVSFLGMTPRLTFLSKAHHTLLGRFSRGIKPWSFSLHNRKARRWKVLLWGPGKLTNWSSGHRAWNSRVV